MIYMYFNKKSVHKQDMNRIAGMRDSLLTVGDRTASQTQFITF